MNLPLPTVTDDPLVSAHPQRGRAREEVVKRRLRRFTPHPGREKPFHACTNRLVELWLIREHEVMFPFEFGPKKPSIFVVSMMMSCRPRGLASWRF